MVQTTASVLTTIIYMSSDSTFTVACIDHKPACQVCFHGQADTLEQSPSPTTHTYMYKAPGGGHNSQIGH